MAQKPINVYYVCKFFILSLWVTYSLNKYLSSACYVPGTILTPGHSPFLLMFRVLHPPLEACGVGPHHQSAFRLPRVAPCRKHRPAEEVGPPPPVSFRFCFWSPNLVCGSTSHPAECPQSTGLARFLPNRVHIKKRYARPRSWFDLLDVFGSPLWQNASNLPGGFWASV